MIAHNSGEGSGGSRLFRQTHRLVTQAERVWIVREADATLAPNSPADHCLLCESALTVRCTWEYPREWARLPDSELLRLFS